MWASSPERVKGAVKLTITHEIDRADSKLITAVSGGWPAVVSNLKSLLETGQLATAAAPVTTNSDATNARDITKAWSA